MDYAGLVTAIQSWSGRTEAETVAEIPNFVNFATDGFNKGIPDRQIQPLRVRDMEATATITMTNGVGPLPADYLQYKTALSMASTPIPLDYVTNSYTNVAYPDSAAGYPKTFSITGSTISVFPTSGNDVQMVYYQKIPAISVSVTSNWLLAGMPMLYLHACLLQAGLFNRDNDLIARSQAIVAAGVDGLNETNMLSTFAKVGTRMGMLTP
jgi:hypothetical protein